jgi:hypothetical protein
MEKVTRRKKHWWLCVYVSGENAYGSFLGSKRMLSEYLSGSPKYEDREIEPIEIVNALLKSVSVRKVEDRKLVIIHYVE